MSEQNATTTAATASKPAVKRKTAQTKRATTTKKAAATRSATRGNAARTRTATAAKKSAPAQTARQAKAEARTTTRQVQETAERVVLVPVGAALVARDSVAGTVEQLRERLVSLASLDAEKELKAQRKRLETELKKFERRGRTERTKVERELRQRRTRLERDLRDRRRDVEARGELLTARVGDLVQNGRTTGTQVATRVSERVASLV